MNSDLIATDPPDQNSDQQDQSDPGDDAGGAKAHAGRQKQSQRPRYPNREECLGNLAQLAGLVAMKMLTPAQANSIRALYSEILRSHDAAKHSASAPIDDEVLLRGFREQPELFKLVEPFLTDAQVALILKEATNDEPE